MSKDQKDAFKVKMNDISVTYYFSIFISLGVGADPFLSHRSLLRRKFEKRRELIER